jgi:hypothetical protein
VLGDAVEAAARAVRITVPAVSGPGGLVLAWGSQLDVQEIKPGGKLDGLTDKAVAAYIANADFRAGFGYLRPGWGARGLSWWSFHG